MDRFADRVPQPQAQKLQGLAIDPFVSVTRKAEWRRLKARRTTSNHHTLRDKGRRYRAAILTAQGRTISLILRPS